MREGSPVVLIHATLWWPLAARLAIRFRDLGCRVQPLCPGVHPLRSVRGIERSFPIRSMAVQQSLIEAIEKSGPDYIVPTDDRSVLQLHALAAGHPQYRELIVRSLGDEKSFAIVRNRMSLLSLADSLNIATAQTVALRGEEDAARHAESWRYPGVVKRDGTSGGRGVAVVNTPQELTNAYRRLRKDASLPARLKRRFVDGDILAFFRTDAVPPDEMSLQAFVPGIPANAMYSCFKGKLLATLQVRTVCAQHATGAASIVERIDDPRIEDAGRKLAQSLSLSGFFGLDFHIETGSGRPYLLEMNPRATQLGHLHLADSRNGCCLAEALWMAWTGRSSSRCASATRPAGIPKLIAFFPQALALGPANPLLTSAWLDRPDEEPELVTELSGIGWPQRRMIYRLFHRFYPVSVDEPVSFPEPESSMAGSRARLVR